MAWASVGTLGSAAAKSAASSIVITTSDATSAGDTVVVVTAFDNVVQTASGEATDTQTVTDSAGGNTWTKAKGWCYSAGATFDGTIASVWYSKLTNAISSGGTITVNTGYGGTIAKAAGAWRFTNSGSTVTSEGTPGTEAVAATDPGSLDVSGLSSQEYLWVRAIALEDNDIGGFTVTTNFTQLASTETSGGAAGTNVMLRAEFRIFTGTTNPSDPTQAAYDNASVYVALKSGAGQFTADVNETMTLAEANTISAILNSSVAESMTLAESVTATQIYGAVMSESMTLGESVDTLQTFQLPLAESLTLAESINVGLFFDVALAESLTLGEAVQGDMTYVALVSETLTLAEEVGVVFTSGATSTGELPTHYTKRFPDQLGLFGGGHRGKHLHNEN